jgi:hypothetical protein
MVWNRTRRPRGVTNGTTNQRGIIMLLRLSTVVLLTAVTTFACGAAHAGGLSPNFGTSSPHPAPLSRSVVPKVSGTSDSPSQIPLNDKIKGPPPCDTCKK